MKKKLFPLIIITLVITLINTGMIGFLTYDKIDQKIKDKPVVISKDYDKGQSLQLALETEKPVLIWFYVDWCRYCQKLAPIFKKVTKNKEVKKNFAIAYVNAEDPKNKEYVKEYKVHGYPMVFVLKNGKKELISNNLIFMPDGEKLLKEYILELVKD